MNTVELTYQQICRAADIGVRRHVASMRAGLSCELKPNSKERWAMDIDGALGEMAFAKFHGVFWDEGINTFKAPDIGEGIQVRHTMHENGKLIHREKDNTEHTYHLMVGGPKVFRYCGFIKGEDARIDKYLHAEDAHTSEKSWWVPQVDLRMAI